MGYRRQRNYPGRAKLAKVRPRGRSRDYRSSNKETSPAVMKTIISSIIFLSIFVISSIDRPVPQKMIDGVRVAITKEFNIRESVGRLKFVQRYSPKIKSVFGFNSNLLQDDTESIEQPFFIILPAEGKVVGSFSETGGLDIEGEEKLEILSAADGEIVLIDEHTKGYAITVRHNEDLVTVYHNITKPYVQRGEKVKQGDTIGYIDASSDRSPLLHFKVWQNNKPIDPDSLLQHMK